MTEATPDSPQEGQQQSGVFSFSPNPVRIKLARIGVLTLLSLALFLAYLTRHSLAVVNTTMQLELGINNEQFGYLVSAFSAGYLLFQIPGGWFGQRFGTRATLSLLAALWSIMTCITAGVASLYTLIVARFFFGLGQAGLIPNQAQVIKDWFPEERRGTASSILMAAMQVGGVASLALTAWLMRYLSWRVIFQWYAILGLVWGVAFYSWFRTDPRQMRWLQENPESGVDFSGADSGEDCRKAGVPWKPILTHRGFWGLAGQAFFKAAGYNLLVTFFPAMLEHAHQLTREQAGILTTWSLVGIVFGSLIGGRTIDLIQQRTRNKRLSRGGVAMVSLGVTGAIMLAAPWTESGTSLAALMAGAAFASGFAQGPPWAAIIDIGGRQSAVAMGFMNCASSLPGIIISPLTGKLMDHIQRTQGDWNLLILIHAGFYLAAGFCWLLVDPQRPIATEEQTHAV